MRNSQYQGSVLKNAILLAGLIVSALVVGKAEAQEELNFLNREVVLLDCVENANTYVVRNISSTSDQGINQDMNCAIAVQTLLAKGFFPGRETGGVTSAAPGSLNHFLMLFVLDNSALVQRRNPTPLLNPTQDCAFELNFGECPPNLERPQPLGPILNRNDPSNPLQKRNRSLSPIFQDPEPLHPILQRRNP